MVGVVKTSPTPRGSPMQPEPTNTPTNDAEDGSYVRLIWNERKFEVRNRAARVTFFAAVFGPPLVLFFVGWVIGRAIA